jgi:putative transposase
VVELNIQEDHIHVITNVPPKVSISELMGTLKGRTAIRIFNKFSDLKEKPY